MSSSSSQPSSRHSSPSPPRIATSFDGDRVLSNAEKVQNFLKSKSGIGIVVLVAIMVSIACFSIWHFFGDQVLFTIAIVILVLFFLIREIVGNIIQ